MAMISRSALLGFHGGMAADNADLNHRQSISQEPTNEQRHTFPEQALQPQVAASRQRYQLMCRLAEQRNTPNGLADIQDLLTLSDAIKIFSPAREEIWKTFTNETGAENYKRFLLGFAKNIDSSGNYAVRGDEQIKDLESGLAKIEKDPALRTAVFAEMDIRANNCIDNKIYGIFSQNLIIAHYELDKKNLNTKELYPEVIKFAWEMHAKEATIQYAKSRGRQTESLEFMLTLASSKEVAPHMPTCALIPSNLNSFQFPAASGENKKDSFIDQFVENMLLRQKTGGLRSAVANVPAWQNALRREYPEAYSLEHIDKLTQQLAESWYETSANGVLLDIPKLQAHYDAAIEAGETAEAGNLWSQIRNLQESVEQSKNWVESKIHLERTDTFLAEQGIDLDKAKNPPTFIYVQPEGFTADRTAYRPWIAMGHSGIERSLRRQIELAEANTLALI